MSVLRGLRLFALAAAALASSSILVSRHTQATVAQRHGCYLRGVVVFGDSGSSTGHVDATVAKACGEHDPTPGIHVLPEG